MVVSDDRTVDIFPRLRPRLSRGEIAGHVAALVSATIDNHQAPLRWLSARRFYLDAAQCEQINATIERLDAAPLEVGELRFLEDRFEVDPEFDPSYLTQ
ncbi:hypothetical protein D9M72_625580 [compost metagenome]